MRRNQRGYFNQNRDRLLSQMRQYKQNKRLTDIDWVKRMMFTNAKSRAKQRGICFTVKFEDIYWPEKCPVFKCGFNYSGGGRGYSHWLPSFDRIDPKQGYVPGNVQIISARANRLKCDANIEELKRLVEYLEVFA